MGGKRLLIVKEGDKFNYLTFISETFTIARSTGYKVRVANCICDCGKMVKEKVQYVVNGRRKSCGCKNVRTIPPSSVTHGMSKTRIFAIWKAMRARCNATKGNSFKYYGSRGIVVCPEWDNSFDVFYMWAMANGYTDELTLDRRENDKGYYPDNCRWVTMEVQSNNTRANVFIEYNGERKTLSQWSKSTRLHVSTITNRIKSGWLIEDVLTNRSKNKVDKNDF